MILLLLAFFAVDPPPDIWAIVWPSFASYLSVGGPAQPYSDCCAYINDLDNDGDVDLHDFAQLQNGWGNDGYAYTPFGGETR